MITLAAVTLIVLHTIDGRLVLINPAQVTNLLAAKQYEPNKVLPGGINCVVNLTDGKFISVSESCDIVRKLIEQNGGGLK